MKWYRLVLATVVLTANSKFSDGYVESFGDNLNLPQARSEPQVAMACDKGARYYNQYMDDAGHWVTDFHQEKGCMKNKEDILDYCKQVYPKLDVTNIVESTHSYMIDDWCKIGQEKCKESFWVTPYRCLEGKFQSDALLVPEPCQFDHIHNASWCWEFARWNGTARKACQDRMMKLHAFAMLLPCGTDVFTGVEFVCCPGKDTPTEMQPIEKNYPPQLTSEINIEAEVFTPEPDLEIEEGTRDPYFTKFDPRIEHDAFKSAERRLEVAQKRKMTKVMKEWTDLEEKYQKMKAKDPVRADKFKVRMTERFQQTLNALKDQGVSEKHQLIALHQQRIIAQINERKKNGMTCFVKALNKKPILASGVQKCLNQLLRALYKDRHHTISHFRHLLSTAPEDASIQQSSAADHLLDIDRMVNETLQMLDHYPDVRARIMPEMSQLIGELKRRDSVPVELTETPAPPRQQQSVPSTSAPGPAQPAEPQQQQQQDQQPAAGHVENGLQPEPASQIDIGVEVERGPDPADHQRPAALVADQHLEPLVSHARAHEHLQDEASYTITREVYRRGYGRGVYFTVALASIALTVALVAAVVALRRRHRAPQNRGFIEVDQVVTPEERHLSHMQINGYENPTYKYFENK